MPRYHVWFATKRRKRLLEGDVSSLAEHTIREVAKKDGIRLLECKTAIDHVHLMIELDSPVALPSAMKALKGKSAHQVFEQVPELKLDGRTKNLWQRGYGWKPVQSAAEATVRRYIRTQMKRLEKFAR
jgi:putative transposase